MASPFLGDGKVVANKGKERNKKPLQNKIYKVEIIQPKSITPDLEKYKFKDVGFLILYWGYEKNINKHDFSHGFSHGFITSEKLKELLGEKQWSKFCQGKREFVIQRRIGGKNIKKRDY